MPPAATVAPAAGGHPVGGVGPVSGGPTDAAGPTPAATARPDGARPSGRTVDDACGSRDVDLALAAGHDALATIERQVAAASLRFDAVAPALALLLAVEGRVAVTGLGKSGLVGAKLAATLASTGSPAFFVHAADALHGDAGMVMADDLLLAISKSGDTREVVQFAELVQARGVTVLAMTGCNGGSRLHALADATIDIGVGCEADPWDMVPTTSTAVTAVVGDALAIALMVARGFGPADFFVHHPGGALGDRLRPEAG